ncbi:hypoxanthine phosphoribosyltransferase [Synechocystis sp. LKSZ1]|uniref:hypoxanthine phosphoribosyltransferase n=1 Tax=Synechocystis sp. LKSZ1 TaxID=3144951 RepID=UPI00336C114D
MTLSLTPLLSTLEIVAIIQRLAQAIDQDYNSQSLTAVVVLKGAVFFAADLLRALQTPVAGIEFVQLASYGPRKQSSGTVVTIQALSAEQILGKHLLVIEDIIDTGRSLAHLLAQLQAHHPCSLKVCVLLDKPSCRQVTVPIDYIGQAIPDRFVVGYGLDFDEQYRQLPAIYTLA